MEARERGNGDALRRTSLCGSCCRNDEIRSQQEHRNSHAKGQLDNLAHGFSCVHSNSESLRIWARRRVQKNPNDGNSIPLDRKEEILNLSLKITDAQTHCTLAALS